VQVLITAKVTSRQIPQKLVAKLEFLLSRFTGFTRLSVKPCSGMFTSCDETSCATKTSGAERWLGMLADYGSKTAR